jgi:hypothetical protein
VSGIRVLRRAFGRLALLRLDIEVDRLVVTALRRAAPGPCPALVDAGLEAGLGYEDALNRVATAFLAFSGFNLSDDLADGDCDYLPLRAAHGVVLILNGLFFSSLRELALTPEVEADVLADLTSAEEAQVLELTTKSWNAERIRLVTDGIACCQWSAYLRLVWARTPLEHLAADVARAVGRVGLLVGDIKSYDPRYTTLSPADRCLVLQEALNGMRALKGFDLRFPRAVIARSEPILVEQLRSLHSSELAVHSTPCDDAHPSDEIPQAGRAG